MEKPDGVSDAEWLQALYQDTGAFTPQSVAAVNAAGDAYNTGIATGSGPVLGDFFRGLSHVTLAGLNRRLNPAPMVAGTTAPATTAAKLSTMFGLGALVLGGFMLLRIVGGKK